MYSIILSYIMLFVCMNHICSSKIFLRTNLISTHP